MTVPVHPSLSGGPVGRDSLDGLPQELAFPKDEYEARIDGVRKAMREADVDVLIVRHPLNVVYLSGFQTFAVYNTECVIVPMDGPPVLVVHPPEIGTALLHTWLDEVHGYPDPANREAYQASLLADRRLDRSRVGVEKQSPGMAAGSYERLREALPRAELVDASDVVSTVKVTKSPREIEYIRRAARITDAGGTAAIDAAREGGTDNDVAAAANRAMFDAGTEYMCISPIVTSGARSGVLHSTHKRNTLEKGDSVCIELGGCYQRYTAPIMRTVSIGEPRPEIARLADACITALNNVISTMRPGVTADEVAKAGWDGIARAGPGLVFHGSFAYSVGASFPPDWADRAAGITLGDRTRLRSGMVFHHPVGLRRLGRYGTMFSETTLVTEDGCEVLTGVDRKLFVR